MPYNLQGVGFRNRDTSAAAAQQVDAHTWRGYALAALRRADSPLTADQIAGQIGAPITTIRPRMTELAHLGLIEDSGQRVATPAGRGAIAWRIKAGAQ